MVFGANEREVAAGKVRYRVTTSMWITWAGAGVQFRTAETFRVWPVWNMQFFVDLCCSTKAGWKRVMVAKNDDLSGRGGVQFESRLITEVPKSVCSYIVDVGTLRRRCGCGEKLVLDTDNHCVATDEGRMALPRGES